MQRAHLWVWGTLVLTAWTASCSGGGGSGSTRGNESPDGSLPRLLTVRAQYPESGDTRVPLGASVIVGFDAPLHPECLNPEQTYLVERDTGTRVLTSLNADEGDLVMTPVAGLKASTYYTCHLSPLLCDNQERLLEEDPGFTFRTVDLTPPTVQEFSFAANSTGIPKRVELSARFDEDVTRASVTTANLRLLGPGATPIGVAVRLVKRTAFIAPVADLLPNTRYTLVLDRGIQDLNGNAMARTERSFTTGPEASPQVVAVQPNHGNVSPDAHLFATFDASVEVHDLAASVSLTDTSRKAVPFTAQLTDDRRVLRVVPSTPLVPGSRYELQVTGGPGIRTPGGLAVTNTRLARFSVSTDRTPPGFVASLPATESVNVAIHATPTLTFDEQLDFSRLNEDTIELADDVGPVPCTVTTGSNSAQIIVTPNEPLAGGARYTVTFKGGPLGVRDLAGNPLAEDLQIRFVTTTDRTGLEVTTSPTHGHSAVDPDSTFSAFFSEPIDPDSVHDASVFVTDAGNRRVPGALTLTGGNRILTFKPAERMLAGAWYQVTLRGGPEGITKVSGSGLSQSSHTSFRIGSAEDTTPPDVEVTVNSIAARRRGDLAVPQSGFELSILAEDPSNYDIDLGSFEVTITGPSTELTTADLLAGGTISKSGLRFVVPESLKFEPGEYTIVASAKDLAGNRGFASEFALQVLGDSDQVVPFARTQVVYVRFDLDRDGNGRPDFVDDLYRLGLLSEGDPAGTNQRMTDLMREGILSLAHHIFGRKRNGGPLDQDSIALLFTAVEPKGLTYAEMAFGGLDPTAPANRSYGSNSSGVLGRAYFDHRNGSRNDNNTSTSPGLGVFGGELFLFEVQTHLTLFPTFVTTFAKRFQKLVPEMGGVPAGSHPLDATVLAPDFDLGQAGAVAVRRYYDVLLGADDWAAAMAVVLAHETGHSIGLVARGAAPEGLHGDNSLHNSYPNLGDVMSSAVGYESLVNLNYRFRDLNAAYLQHRVLLR